MVGICCYPGCTSQPNFNIPGGKAIYCSKHKLSDMVNVMYTPCCYSNCVSQASYNILGQPARYCAKHKTKDMISLKKRICEFYGCTLSAIFDLPGGKGKFCGKHKTEAMIDIIHKICQNDTCTMRAIYDIPNGKGKFCTNHKEENMIDISSTNRCNFLDCKIKGAAFGNPGDSTRFCIKHKEPDMINLNLVKCTECTTGSIYGIPGSKSTHCAKHRKPGMIRRSKHKCKIKKCSNIAIYGTNFTAIHCETHKDEHDINLIERECSSCSLIMILDENNKCEYCNPEIFKYNKLYKQTLLMNYLDSLTKLPIPNSTDKTIENTACGKERPDRVYDLGDKIIIVECDEHQHKYYSKECEIVRMLNIGQAFGGTPVYFIRWNPDDYIPFNTNDNIIILKERLQIIGKLIENIVNKTYTLPLGLVSVLYLFYDNWASSSEATWRVLQEYENSVSDKKICV